MKNLTRGFLASKDWEPAGQCVIPWVWLPAWCLVLALVEGLEEEEAGADSRRKLVAGDQGAT